MLRKGVAILAALAVLLALVPACKSGEIGTNTLYGYAVGSSAIDFTLNDLSGNPVTLSSFIGRPVMVNFWDTA
jgi:cytochrome oxidase Cu insertion factor (SCO1/SenC/PrrC family)